MGTPSLGVRTQKRQGTKNKTYLKHIFEALTSDEAVLDGLAVGPAHADGPKVAEVYATYVSSGVEILRRNRN